MKLRFWARREHYHRQFLDYLTRFIRCAGCGHMLFAGHVANKRVKVVNRKQLNITKFMVHLALQNGT